MQSNEVRVDLKCSSSSINSNSSKKKVKLNQSLIDSEDEKIVQQISSYRSSNLCRANPWSFVDCLYINDHDNLDNMFDNVMHHTGTPFTFYKHALWKKFFNALHPIWTSTYQTIGTTLLMFSYADVMNKVFRSLQQFF